ncbi:hypothetical protein GGF50DRAFT_116103 [Schizophyllum commune]
MATTTALLALKASSIWILCSSASSSPKALSMLLALLSQTIDWKDLEDTMVSSAALQSAWGPCIRGRTCTTSPRSSAYHTLGLGRPLFRTLALQGRGLYVVLFTLKEKEEGSQGLKDSRRTLQASH